MRSESFRKGVKDGIPIGLGYFAVSFTFGMMAVADGLSIWQAVLISLTNVTSAGQFAGLEIMVMSGSYWEMALTQLIINLRYCLMSFSLAQKFRRDESLVHRYIAAFGVTDEIFGISASQPGKVSAFYNYGAMCVAIPGWVLWNPGRSNFRKSSSGFYDECTQRGYLRYVSGADHTSGKETQTGTGR